MRRFVLAGLAVVLLLGMAAPALAQPSASSDFTVHQFFLPGTATSGWRVHTNGTVMDLTLLGTLRASGGYKVAYTYAHGDYVGVGASNSGMPIAGSNRFVVNGVTGTGPLYQRTPYAGSVLAIALSANTTITRGSAHAEATVLRNAATAEGTLLSTTIGAALTNTQYSTNTQARGVTSITASDGVGCRVSTDAALLPVTAIITCTVIVEQ